MLGRALSPPAPMHSVMSSAAQLSGFVSPPKTIPAIGFARAGQGSASAASRQQAVPGSSSGPGDVRNGGEPLYRSPSTQPATSPPSSSKYPYMGFNTASRTLEGRNNMQPPTRVASVDPTRHFHLAPGSSGSSGTAPPPPGPFAATLIKDGRTIEQIPPVIQYGPNIFSSPPPMPATTPRLSPSSARPQHLSQGLHAFPVSQAPSQPLPPSSSANFHPVGALSPPPTTSQKRSPSPAAKLNVHPAPARTSPVPREPANRTGKAPETHQGAFVGSPLEFPRLESRAALPPQSTSAPALVTIVPAPDKPGAEELPVRMCVVCFDQEPDVRFAARCPTEGCQHGTSVCVSCLERHILVAIHHTKTTEVRCPHPDCGKVLEYRDVYSSVRDWSQLAYYEFLLLRWEKGNQEDFFWCKNPLCKSGQEHKAGRKQPIVVCSTCHHKSCYVHDRPWHEGMTCEQFDVKLRMYAEQDSASRTYITHNTKPCPKCKRQIERNGGCDHMVCRPPGGCGHEFCWECLGNGSTHKQECKHHHTAGSRARRGRRRTQPAARPYIPAA